QQYDIALLHRALPVIPVIETAQQRRSQWLAVVARPLVDDQPAARIELLTTVFEKAPGQVTDARPLVGIQVEKDQVGGFRTVEQLDGISDANGQPRIIVEAEVFHGQTWHVRAQLDGLDILQRQVLQTRLGQVAGAEAEKQRGFRRIVATRAKQHGTGVVVLEPAGIALEYGALFDGITELEKAVGADLHHANHPERIVHLGQQDFVLHFIVWRQPRHRYFSHSDIPNHKRRVEGADCH